MKAYSKAYECCDLRTIYKWKFQAKSTKKNKQNSKIKVEKLKCIEKGLNEKYNKNIN